MAAPSPGPQRRRPRPRLARAARQRRPVPRFAARRPAAAAARLHVARRRRCAADCRAFDPAAAAAARPRPLDRRPRTGPGEGRRDRRGRLVPRSAHAVRPHSRSEPSATSPASAPCGSEHRGRRTPGAPATTIVVMAHRDDIGIGPGANDNASGTAALIELARAYAQPPKTPPTCSRPGRIVFLSTDGGAFGGLGAVHFSGARATGGRTSRGDRPRRRRGPRHAGLEIGGDTPRSPEPASSRPPRADRRGDRVHPAPCRRARASSSTSASRSALYEQARSSRRDPGGDDHDRRRPSRRSVGDKVGRLERTRLGELGRAGQNASTRWSRASSSHRARRATSRSGTDRPRLGNQARAGRNPAAVRGGSVDLYARAGASVSALAPAVAQLAEPACLLAGRRARFRVLSPSSAPGRRARRGRRTRGRPSPAGRRAARAAPSSWPHGRSRRRPAVPAAGPPEEELAGYVAACPRSASSALLIVATNPFALLFVLPSLHAWLWLPQVRRPRAGADRPVRCWASRAGNPRRARSPGATASGSTPLVHRSSCRVGYIRRSLFAVGLAGSRLQRQLVMVDGGPLCAVPERDERDPRADPRARSDGRARRARGGGSPSSRATREG